MFHKLSYLLSIIILMTVGMGFGADPKAAIQGKSTATSGSSVWLKTEGASGKTFSWKIIPPSLEEDFTVLPIFGGLDDKGMPIIVNWAHFSSSKTGTVYFLFAATEDNKIDIAVHQLVYGEPTPTPGPTPTPIPTPDVVRPSEDLVALVQPVISILKTNSMDTLNFRKDINNLTQFYIDLADMVARDTSTQLIKTTSDLRQVNIDAGKLMFGSTGIKNRYVNLGATIDTVLATKLGLDIVPLTGNKRMDAIMVFKAIAWSAVEAGK